MRRSRQQGVEDRRGDGDVDGGQHHLHDRHPPAGQADLVAEQAHVAEDARQRDVADHDRPQQRTDRVERGDVHVLAEERHRRRFDEQDRPAQHHAAETERQAAERHRLGDLDRRQSPMRIQPVAHRRARHGGKSQIVRQRVGAERGEGDAAVGNLVPGVDGAQPVVERQHAVGEHRPDEGDHQRAHRDVAQRGLDVAQPEVAEFLLHDIERADQQQDAENRRQVAQTGSQDAACALVQHRVQAASAGRARADSISATVSSMPYSAMKPPKRGPSCWPSST